MQSKPKFTGYYLICVHLKSLNVTHLKTRYPKKSQRGKGKGGGGGHIDPTPREIGLSLCGNIKVKESTIITFTNLGKNLKVY